MEMLAGLQQIPSTLKGWVYDELNQMMIVFNRWQFNAAYQLWLLNINSWSCIRPLVVQQMPSIF